MGTQGGIFSSVTQVVHASKQAFHIYQKLSLRERKQLIQAIREGLRSYCLEFAALACEETGMGKAEDKAIKIKLALEETPGPEDFNYRNNARRKWNCLNRTISIWCCMCYTSKYQSL